MQGFARHQDFVIFAPFLFQCFQQSAMKPAKCRGCGLAGFGFVSHFRAAICSGSSLGSSWSGLLLDD